MRSSASTIVGLGIVAALFLAVMSMFYLQQLPSKADLARLETELRSEYGLYLASTAPMELSLAEPDEEGGRLGVRVVCTMRPDIRKRPSTVRLYLERMAESIVDHPDWRGKIDYAVVSHAPPLRATAIRRPEPAKAAS